LHQNSDVEEKKQGDSIDHQMITSSTDHRSLSLLVGGKVAKKTTKQQKVLSEG